MPKRDRRPPIASVRDLISDQRVTLADHQATKTQISLERMATTHRDVGTGVPRPIQPQCSDPAVLDQLQAALLADGTRAELLAYLHHQEPDEALAVDEAATRAQASTWGRIARTYIRLTGDRAVPVALQDPFIAEADASHAISPSWSSPASRSTTPGRSSSRARSSG